MKFAKELEDDLVPEWRVKYFNYKIGKKKVKAVSRALRAANRTPQVSGRPRFNSADSEEELPFTHYDFTKRHEHDHSSKPNTPQSKIQQPRTPQSKHGAHSQHKQASGASHVSQTRPQDYFDRRESLTMFARSPPVLIPQRTLDNIVDDSQENTEHERVGGERDDTTSSSDTDNAAPEEETPLHKSADGRTFKGRPRYGSIIGSPPNPASVEPLPTLKLPDPALDPAQQKPPTERGVSTDGHLAVGPVVSKQPSETPTNAPGYWDNQPQKRKMSKIPDLSKKLFKKADGKRSDLFSSKQKMKRAFATLTLDSPAVTTTQFEAYRELDAKQDEFFTFLDKELDKIEDFYKMKEDEATSRLTVLREQLHEMRDRRLEDLRIAKKGGQIADKGFIDGQIPVMSNAFLENGKSKAHGLFEPFTNAFQQNGKIGKTSQAREELGSPRQSEERKRKKGDRGDYVRKQQPHEKVPYRNAKRKLKLALQEFYRGLELLKSYALLNRTAFRKINKKYDKAVMARPPLRYMSEKVNSAHFVQSTLVEETLVSIEDLYARYFERGNRKIAVNKLRSHLRQGDHSAVSFRNGLFVAAGTGFAVSGLVNGAPYLNSENLVVKTQASYLFQMYGGYFLAVLLFLFFVLDCRIWTKNRVNYIFVFEYDTRHTLDWRQLAELPCFFLFLNGFILWLNFQFQSEHVMYLYWPIVLIGITVAIIFFPFKVLYYHARKWWLYSNWRLLLAGLYPVEFRDFYLGDMYCSETYTMSQLEVFFCIYVNRWNDPMKCNSNHSRLLGFLTTLPPIWRALQCLRRYYDSRNWFPHLANFAKYCCNISYYMTLSLYRIHINSQMRALFITFALLNGLYCGFWDVFMDFSLGNPWSKNFLLRDNLAFRKKRVYYFVIIADIVLRQQWVFYAIFTHDLQHSAIMSFLVGLAEVFRRGIWSLFRVENEHCNNVQKFRASRDIPLPYSVPESRKTSLDTTNRPDTATSLSPKSSRIDPDQSGASLRRTGTDVEQANGSAASVRNRRKPFAVSLQRVGTAIAAAHAQDFQKKRRPEVVGRGPEDQNLISGRWHEEDEDDEDEDAEDQASRHAAAEERIRNERRLDSREDVRDGQPEEQDAREDEAGASSSGDGRGRRGTGTSTATARRRAQSTREERAAATFREADEDDEVEISEARERTNRAQHQ